MPTLRIGEGSSGRSEGGFRLHTEADVEKVLVIRRMKPLGFASRSGAR